MKNWMLFVVFGFSVVAIAFFGGKGEWNFAAAQGLAGWFAGSVFLQMMGESK